MTHPPIAVRDVMTPFTRTIDADQPIAAASRLMRELDIRHLPVLDEGRLCGIVSERDLLLLETLVGFGARQTTVSDAMSLGVYTASPSTPLTVVLRAMSLQKYGCAVVLEGSSVVGIVTTVDVCRSYADHLLGDTA